MIAENGLSFIETSALDASNVDSAFETNLTGVSYCPRSKSVSDKRLASQTFTG